MKHRHLYACLVIGFAGIAEAAVPTITSSKNSLIYYEIGGAPSAPATGLTQTYPIGVGGTFGLGYSCGKFDPKFSVRNTLDNLRDKIVTLKDAALGSLAGLPGAQLCKANSLLCQLNQDFTARAEELFRVSIKSCEQLEDIARKGGDPWGEWIEIGKAEEWNKQSSQGKSPSSVKKSIAKSKGTSGVTWIGGKKAGGKGQPPIHPIEDTAKAAFNILSKRPISESRAISTRTQTRLSKNWSTPAQAARWITNVVGDQEIRLTDDSTPKSSPGLGLLPLVEPERAEVYESLQTLINSASISSSELDKLSSSSIRVTPQLIDALRRHPMSDIMIERISNDLALSRVVDQAMLARRLLITGSGIPEVTANSPASAKVEKSVQTLEREVEHLLFERDTRKRLVSDTLAIIIRSARPIKAVDMAPVEQP